MFPHQWHPGFLPEVARYGWLLIWMIDHGEDEDRETEGMGDEFLACAGTLNFSLLTSNLSPVLLRHDAGHLEDRQQDGDGDSADHETH